MAAMNGTLCRAFGVGPEPSRSGIDYGSPDPPSAAILCGPDTRHSDHRLEMLPEGVRHALGAGGVRMMPSGPNQVQPQQSAQA